MTTSPALHVEVLYALPNHAYLIPLTLPPGATIETALHASGLLQQYPDIRPGETHQTGIYGKRAPLATPLRDRDRVELYRPLTADPKNVRRKRAAARKRGA